MSSASEQQPTKRAVHISVHCPTCDEDMRVTGLVTAWYASTVRRVVCTNKRCEGFGVVWWLDLLSGEAELEC